MFLFLLIILANLGISYWNAKQAGRVWAESKAVGGWVHTMTWCAAIQSAAGFTMVYAEIIAIVAYQMNYISGSTLELAFNLLYLMIILPILGTGFAITIQSWINVKREKSLANLGVAGWNTFATAYNTYGAIRNVGAAFDNVRKSFGDMKSSDDDNKALVIVIVALLAGIITTMLIIRMNAGTLPVPDQVIRKHIPTYGE